jgi:hypothetical protein
MVSAGRTRLLRRLELLSKVLESEPAVSVVKGMLTQQENTDKETQTVVSLQQGSHHLVSQIKQLGGVVEALRSAEVKHQLAHCH